jgi:NADH dehydrogenase [ubiquinone] 1 alpha subcomplex assembly factor 7
MAGLVNTHGTLSQRTFLKRMGIDARVEAIGSQTVSEAAKRLVDLTGMGGQYRVLGITAKKDHPPSSPSAGENSADEEVWPFVNGIKDEEESDRKVR